jgi:hypothetical protein
LPPRQAPNRFREYPENSHRTSRALSRSFHPIISSLARQARLLRGDTREMAQSARSPRERSRLGRKTRDYGMERRPQSSRCRVRVFRTMREVLDVARDGARTPHEMERKNGRLTVCA